MRTAKETCAYFLCSAVRGEPCSPSGLVDLPSVEKMGSTTPTFSLDPVTGKTGLPEAITGEERTAFWPRFSR
jgi:hypothetical protein